MKNLKKILSNSIFQSAIFGLLITLLVVFVWETPIKKYNIEVEPFAQKSENEVHWFAGDFDDDGNSERIRCFKGINSNSMDIVHYDNDGNLKEHYHFNQSEWAYQLFPKVFDINEDGQKELLFFSTRNDSIFINACNLVNFSLTIDHLYFNTFERKRDNYAQSARFGDFGDFDKDGKNELFFYFDAGFGLAPRGIFKLDFPSLKIHASNTEYMLISSSTFKDLDADGIPEILTQTSAPSNAVNYKKFTDTISYIVALDYNLEFVFPPIPMHDKYSSVICIPALKKDSLFYAMFYSRSNHKAPHKMMVLTKDGKIVNQKIWTNIINPENRYRGMKVINDKPYVFFHDVGHFELTPSLKKLPDNLNSDQNEPSITPFCIDLDNDGKDEWVHQKKNTQIIIYNEKSGENQSFDSPLIVKSIFKIYPFYKNHIVTKYMVDTGTGFFFFKYQRNNTYFYLYFIYVLVFLFLSCSIYFILYLQKKNIEKRWNTERQLSELQFNSVKNQLNPHFLFNALNSVAYMINEGRKDEAYDFLSINSRMIQRVMNDANEVKRSLTDEINFTKDYLKIQKHRFKNRFEFNFNIHPDVNLKIQVPKMCIHTYAENAIKHGFRNTKLGGVLNVNISPINNGVCISISDNGMGRKAASEYKDSSGNGINIMDEFYRLFEQYHGYKIECRIVDLKEPAGTQVELKIQIMKGASDSDQ